VNNALPVVVISVLIKPDDNGNLVRYKDSTIISTVEKQLELTENFTQ
jgi:hypothetical protein